MEIKKYLKKYFTEPKDGDFKNHDVRARRESYDNRANATTALLAALGGSLAMIGSTSFARVTEDIWGGTLAVLFITVLITGITLGSALILFKHESRRIVRAPFQNFNPQIWPKSAERWYTWGLLCARLLAILIVATLTWSMASPPPSPTRPNSPPPTSKAPQPKRNPPCPPVPRSCEQAAVSFPTDIHSHQRELVW